MAELSKSAASLRISGDDLDPTVISRMLGASPNIGVAKGGKQFAPKGTPTIARTGMWLVKSADCSPADLDAQILSLLAPLTDDLAIWQEISPRYRAEIFAGLFLEGPNEGTRLSPHTLSALGSRGAGTVT